MSDSLATLFPPSTCTYPGCHLSVGQTSVRGFGQCTSRRHKCLTLAKRCIQFEEDLTITQKIHDFIKNGVLNEVDKIRLNLGVWDLITARVEELKQYYEQVQQLFIHLQFAASDTFTLNLDRIYDTPTNANTRYVCRIFPLVTHLRKELVKEQDFIN